MSKQSIGRSFLPLRFSRMLLILATDEKSVLMTAAMNIPTEYKEQLDQVEIVVRPF